MARRRLLDQMAARGVDALVLLGSGNVAYATGHVGPAADNGRAVHQRTIAVVTTDEDVLVAVDVDFDDGAAALAAIVGDFPGTLAIDAYTMPLRAALAGRGLGDAAPVLSAAKLVKEPDEIEAIHRAQQINEAAMADVLAYLRPGIHQADLTARFLRGIYPLGADQNTVDCIWQVMPKSRAEAPESNTGSLAFPLPGTGRTLDAGDVVWIDTGIGYRGYASDFGRTWLVGADPDARQRACFQRWRTIVDALLDVAAPGATGRDLTRVATEANDGVAPWLPHLYVAHGLGTESAELPLIGTDLGDAFDESQVLAAGTVLVLEPVVWSDDGTGGYRGEEVVAVTADGARLLSDFTYAPYE